MIRPRTIAIIASMFLLLTVVAAACSSDDSGDQPAAAQSEVSGFELMSPNFTEIRPKIRIPIEHTCYDPNSSPPLSWVGAPAGTQSFALTAEDLDHDPGVWVHWVVYNIPADATELVEAIPTSTDSLPDGTLQGKNDFRNIGYEGPCPIPVVVEWEWFRNENQGDKAHKYHFRLYALDTKLDLAAGKTKFELLDAMEGHILAEANTTGKYQVTPVTSGKQDLGQSILGVTSSEATPERLYNTRGDLITPTPSSGQ